MAIERENGSLRETALLHVKVALLETAPMNTKVSWVRTASMHTKVSPQETAPMHTCTSILTGDCVIACRGIRTKDCTNAYYWLRLRIRFFLSNVRPFQNYGSFLSEICPKPKAVRNLAMEVVLVSKTRIKRCQFILKSFWWSKTVCALLLP